MNNFEGERRAAGILALAGMEKSVRDAMEYGAERTAFGNHISHYQVWRHRFAELLTSIEAGKWLTYRALDLMNRGQKCVREVTMAKLFTSELSQKVSYDCMQMFGGF